MKKLQFYLIPCNLDKTPSTPNGEKDATNIPREIITLLRDFGGPNLAIATGPSDLIAIDEDCYKPIYVKGCVEEAIKAPELPKTVEWRSARGGRVQIFKRNGLEIASRNGILPGVDVKCSTGYVLIPPSVNAEGLAYTWINSPKDTPIADAPPELIAWLTKATEKKKLATAEDDLFLRAGNGRWEWCRRFAGGMRRWGWSAASIEGALLAFTEYQCEPDGTISRGEITRLAEWAGRLPPDGVPPSACEQCERNQQNSSELGELDEDEEDDYSEFFGMVDGVYKRKDK